MLGSSLFAIRKLFLLSEGLFVNKGKSLHDFDLIAALCLTLLLSFAFIAEWLFIDELLLFLRLLWITNFLFLCEIWDELLLFDFNFELSEPGWKTILFGCKEDVFV